MRTFLTLDWKQTVGLVFGLLVFAALLGGFAFLSRRISKGAVFPGRRIKVVDRVMLSRDVSVLLVQVGLRLLAVGVGRGGVTLLCELSSSDFSEARQKEDETGRNAGFWRTFTRGMKANFTRTTPEPDTSFSELLRTMADRDPVAGAAEDAGDAGYPYIEEKQEPAPQRFRRANYQNSIENMSRLSEPDTFDRRTRVSPHRAPEAPPRRPVSPPREAPGEPVTEKDRTERIDRLLDMVSQRQARFDDRNNTGDKE